jgi:hypothetical protein
VPEEPRHGGAEHGVSAAPEQRKLQADYLNDKDEVKDTSAHEVFLVAQVKF